MSEELHANFLSAKEMVEESMSNPSKTVKYLPAFMRVYPEKDVQLYREATQNSVLSLLRNQYCVTSCKQDKNCQSQCQSYYNEAISNGLDVIRKVHKQYKLQALDEDE